MRRVEKPAGRHNIVVTDVERPDPAETEVLIRARRSLISRGSELWRRYTRADAVDPDIMGYSLAGEVVEAGAEIAAFTPGDRVAAVAPHAEYVTVEVRDPQPDPAVVVLPDDVSMAAGTFWPLTTSAVLWIRTSAPEEGETAVVQGQGLVGSLCLQVAGVETGGELIAVDALSLRCELAERLGADAVIDISEDDPVATVEELTDGNGADVVIGAVGGPAGVEAFEQAQRMVADGGLIQVIGLYEDEPLPLDSGDIQGRRLVGGYLDSSPRPEASTRGLELLAQGAIGTDTMVTHRFDAAEAPDAFDLLYDHPGEALGVVLVWE